MDQASTTHMISLRASYQRDGFVSIPQPVVSERGVSDVIAILDPLFARWDQLTPRYAHDLGSGGPAGGTIPEIIDVTHLAPELRRTEAFRVCRGLAEDVLGGPVTLAFDHSIMKPPHNGADTAWHQDAAYVPEEAPPRTVAMWLALQDTPVEMGAMRFIPGSHRSRAEHRRRGGDERAWAMEALDVDESVAVDCPLPRGGLTMHHGITLHGTGPNRTDRPRRAWILLFAPASQHGVRRVVPQPVRYWLATRRRPQEATAARARNSGFPST